MQRIAGLLAFLLLAAGVGGSARESVAVAKTANRTAAVLALVETYSGSRLAWLDPATLRPLAGRSVQLPGGAWEPVHSPNGRFLALGGPGAFGIRIVDLKRMKLTAAVGRTSSQRRVTPLAWPQPRRLIALDSPQPSPTSQEALVVLDPVAGRVVSRTALQPLATVQTTWARAGRRLVGLRQPTQGMAPVRLEIRGSGGGVLRATDIDIVGGSEVENPEEREPRVRFASPAFALDPAGRRAFVVSPERIASVDVETLEATMSQLAEPRSLVGRILSWLEPEAQAKLVTGWSRQATWLGENTLAVSGSTYDGAWSAPAGLELIDTRTGALRMLEPRASAHRVVGEVLLAFGGGGNAATESARGMGISAFSRTGEKLWSALGDEPVWWAEVAGGYVYVLTPEERFPRGVRVLDAATGATLRTVRQELPTFVARP
jgi:hypothetical protein